MCRRLCLCAEPVRAQCPPPCRSPPRGQDPDADERHAPVSVRARSEEATSPLPPFFLLSPSATHRPRLGAPLSAPRATNRLIAFAHHASLAPHRVLSSRRYSTTTGNTETCAGYIADITGLEATDIGDASDDDISAADSLICGAPTWHTGADEQRSGTEWDAFLYERLPNLDLSGKKVAIFGLGDQAGCKSLLLRLFLCASF